MNNERINGREGTEDKRAAWLEEIRSTMESRVLPPLEEGWDLEPAGAVRVIVKQKHWSVPGPDRLGWIDVRKAYDSIDHGWLEEMILLHRFPDWVCNTVRNLSRSWNTRIVVTTKKGREASETTRFRKGLPQALHSLSESNRLEDTCVIRV